MVEMVEARRNADKVERYDLFSGLLDMAQDEQGSEGALSNEELIGGYIDVTVTSGSFSCFSILGKRLIRPFRKHVYLSFCWT
jgi:hypothetical protein